MGGRHGDTDADSDADAFADPDADHDALVVAGFDAVRLSARDDGVALVPRRPVVAPGLAASRPAAASPAELSRAVASALRAGSRLPLALRYRAARAGRLVITVVAPLPSLRSLVRLLVIPLGAALGAPVAALAGSRAYQGDPAHDGAVDDAALRPPLTLAWSRELDGSPGFPLLAGGRVFVIVRTDDPGGGLLYALDRATGRTLWQRPVDAWQSALALDGGRLFVMTEGGFAQALDAATGAALWAGRAPSGFGSTPVASGGRLYALAGSALRALDEAGGSTLWEYGGAYDGAGILRPAATAWWHPASGGHGLQLRGRARVADAERLLQRRPGSLGAARRARLDQNHGEVRDAAAGTKLRDYASAQPPARWRGARRCWSRAARWSRATRRATRLCGATRRTAA